MDAMDFGNKPLFIVSDLHIGDGGPRDNFAADGKQQQFDLFLRYVKQQNGQLIILGDLFEFWQANLAKTIRFRLNLLDHLAALNTIYVVGNHDADLADFIGTKILNHPFFDRMTGPLTVSIAGKTFRLMHGHELDPFNRESKPGWGRILAILAGIIEDRKGSPLLSAGGLTEKSLLRLSRFFMWFWNNSVFFLEKGAAQEPFGSVEQSLTPAQEPARVKGFISLFYKEKCQQGYDVIISGHTHQVGRVGDWYVNSGCWIGLRNHFLRINPDATIEIWEWKLGRPHPTSL